MDNLLAQLRSPDEAESLAGAQALATRLSHAAGPEEKLLVAALKATSIVRTAVDVAAQRREDAPLQHAVLGSLVNLACIGGHQIVKAQGGFAHMLESLRSPKKSVQYFAAADRLAARLAVAGARVGACGVQPQSAADARGHRRDPAAAVRLT